MTEAPLHEWERVTTNEDGAVTGLDLSLNGLKGRLPPDLGRLANLETLTISFAELEGPIPPELGNLQELRELTLSAVGLEGQVPLELGRLTNLKVLWLNNNQLTGDLPESLANLKNLEDFLFSDNLALCAPPSMVDWLQEIDNTLGFTCRSQATPVHAEAEALTAFYHASGGPDWKSDQNWLTDVQLGDWYGVSTDDEGRVFGLFLRDNSLSGEISSELSNLPHLTRLEFGDNSLTGGIPAELSGLANLVWLDLRGNNLTGPIPPELANLSNLETLNLSGNALSGRIPSELGGMSKLTGLVLGGNDLTGPIPPALGNLANLTTLSLDRNDLRGRVPEELSNLTNLELLFISRNYLEDELPQNLTELQELEVFDFDNNYGLCYPASMQDWLKRTRGGFTGSFCPASRSNIYPPPPELMPADPATLALEREVLTVFFNATGGPEWSDSRNWLSEEPVENWHGVTTDRNGNVASLELASNNLTGEIPVELGNLSGLTTLALLENNLTGAIPAELGKLSNLRVVALSNNNLIRNIPSELGDLVNLELLRLEVNRLSGPIPPALGNLPYLTDLLLEANQLSGPVPREMGNLYNLRLLGLSDNLLTGEIPESFAGLKNLNIFWFDQNAGLCVPDSLKGWQKSVGAVGPPCPASSEGAGLALEPAEESDLEALVALYNATGGTGWRNNGNWLIERPLETWHGVTTDEKGRVTELNLGAIGYDGGTFYHLGDRPHGNNLVGEIPPELSYLSNLEVLNLRGNYLTGNIPHELGNLSRLRSLNLSSNFLEGPIPPELGNLSSLYDFSFSYNDLVGVIPASFLELENLHFLDFEVNGGLCAPPSLLERIPGVIDWIVLGPVCAAPSQGADADRTALIAFFNATGGSNWIRRKNWLSDVPIGSWEGVSTDASGRVVGLSLPRNNLTGPIPRDLGNLSRLRDLKLFGNFLTGSLPRELGNLANLSVLDLSYNSLEGAIPYSLSRIENLQYFGYQVNSSLCAPPALQDWLQDIWDKKGLGPICASPSAATDADRAALIAFFHSAGGPDWLNNQRWLSENPVGHWQGVSTDANGRVVKLSLVGNNLTGAIPAEVGNLSALEELELQKNNLTGEVPGSFSQLTNLRKFSFYTNSSLCASPALHDQFQAIGGLGPGCTYPRSEGDESDREALVAFFNATDGPNWKYDTFWLSDLPIGEWWGVTTDGYGRVTELSLSSNNLTGPIPPELSGLSNLAELSLAANNLSGALPPEISNLSNLVVLGINSNNLSGHIPPEMGNMTDLGTLVLSDNKLTGPIPRELGRLTKLTNLNLAGNDLTGPVPPELGGLSKLSALDLGFNGLVGNIPPELGSLIDLIHLQLQRNNLTGTVPQELGSLYNLEGLWVYDNQLEGQIPSSFSQLTGLDHFAFAGNDDLCLPRTLFEWQSGVDYPWGPTCPR